MSVGLDYAINIKEGNFGAINEAKAKTEGLDNAVKRTNEGLGGMKGQIQAVGAAMGIAFIILFDYVGV